MTDRVAGLVLGLLAAVAWGCPSSAGGEAGPGLRLTAAFEDEAARKVPEGQTPAFKQGQPIKLKLSLLNPGKDPVKVRWGPELFSALDVQLQCDGRTLKGQLNHTRPRRMPENTIAPGASLDFGFEVLEGFNPLLALEDVSTQTVYTPGIYSLRAKLNLGGEAGGAAGAQEVESNALDFKIEPIDVALREKLWKQLGKGSEDDALGLARAAVLLGSPLGKQFDERFGTLLQHKSEEVRDVGIQIVARYNQVQGATHFTKEIEGILATDGEVGPRGTAAWALGHFHSKSSIPALIAALRGKGEGVRPAAIRALTALEATEALPALKEVADDKKELAWVRDLAAKAATQIQGKVAGK